MKLHDNREGVEQAVNAASFEHPGLVFPFRSMHSPTLLNNRMTPRRRLGGISSIYRSKAAVLCGELHRDSCPIFNAPCFYLARSGGEVTGKERGETLSRRATMSSKMSRLRANGG